MSLSGERPMRVLRGRAPAKVTLSLRVLGTRPDGYHELDALTVSCSDPNDRIALYPQRRGDTVSVAPAGSAPTGAANNLATKAITLLRPRLPADLPGIRVRLHKQIPMGAGLGGGSADAAMVLTLLGKHFALPRRDLERAAARLGSDVPFALRGTPAFLRGRGERLVAAPGIGSLTLVIATPDFGCDTPLVYRAWDELGSPRSDRVLESDLVDGGLANDLEPAAHAVFPLLGAFRDAVARSTDRHPIMLGSGSSYAVVADDPDHGAAIAARLRADLYLPTVWCGSTVPSARTGSSGSTAR